MIQGGWCTGDLSEVQSELQEGGQDLTRRGFQEEVAQLVGGKGRCTGVGGRSLSGRREHPSLMCDGVTWGANGSCRVLARWAEGGGGAEGGVSLSAVCGPSVDGVSNMWLLQAWRRCPQEERQGQPSHVLTQSKANYRAAPTVSPIQHSRGPNCASPCAGLVIAPL